MSLYPSSLCFCLFPGWARQGEEGAFLGSPFNAESRCERCKNTNGAFAFCFGSSELARWPSFSCPPHPCVLTAGYYHHYLYILFWTPELVQLQRPPLPFVFLCLISGGLLISPHQELTSCLALRPRILDPAQGQGLGAEKEKITPGFCPSPHC